MSNNNKSLFQKSNKIFRKKIKMKNNLQKLSKFSQINNFNNKKKLNFNKFQIILILIKNKIKKLFPINCKETLWKVSTTKMIIWKKKFNNNFKIKFGKNNKYNNLKKKIIKIFKKAVTNQTNNYNKNKGVGNRAKK